MTKYMKKPKIMKRNLHCNFLFDGMRLFLCKLPNSTLLFIVLDYPRKAK